MKNLKIWKNKAFQAFILSFLLGIVITLPNIIGGHGIYTVVSDFNVQQIPFNKMINYSLKEGSFLWTWFNELGSNFIGTFSFYNLFSPFNIIGYLFPSSIFEYLIGPIFILKYAVAGLTSYLFMNRYVKNKNYALIGSLLYSFSGFQLTNTLFYHFHDIVAFFPLLLYSLDNLVLDGKKGKFALVVCLCAFTNWFFFIGEVVFIIIYFIVKVITKSYRINFKMFCQVVIEGILGTLIASVILIPSFLFTLGNPRIGNSWTLQSMFSYHFSVYLEIIRAFLLPPEIMYVRSFISNMNYTSVELYLPLVGIALVISYMLKNKKNWITLLLIICIISMFIPILNSSFFAFKNNYYCRWFYMPILIMCLSSSITLDKKYDLSFGVIFQIIGYFILSIGTLFYIYHFKAEVVFDSLYFVMTIVFSLFGLLAVILLSKLKAHKINYLIFTIFIFVGMFGNYMVYKYKGNSFDVEKSYHTYLKSNNSISKYIYSRSNSSDSCLFNIGYVSLNNNIKAFNSNLNGSNFEFYKSIDFSREVSTVISPKDKLLNDFLGVKYLISCNPDDTLEKYGYKYLEKSGDYIIYKNPEYKKFGFAPNEYISNDEFKKLSTEEKKKVLNEKIVLDSVQIKKYSNLYAKNGDVSYELNKFKYVKNGFKANIISNKDTLAIYTIPYDSGWKAEINDKKVNIEKVDNGMMAIKISKGKNNIEFKYFTPGLKEGIIITVISIISYAIYMIFWDNKKIRSRK